MLVCARIPACTEAASRAGRRHARGLCMIDPNDSCCVHDAAMVHLTRLVWLTRPLATGASGEPAACCSTPCASAAGSPPISSRRPERESSPWGSARSSSKSVRSKRARSSSASPAGPPWSHTRWRSPPATQEESFESPMDVGGATRRGGSVRTCTQHAAYTHMHVPHRCRGAMACRHRPPASPAA